MSAEALLKEALGKSRAARVLVKHPDSLTTLTAVSAALIRVLQLEREESLKHETKFEQMKENVRKL